MQGGARKSTLRCSHCSQCSVALWKSLMNISASPISSKSVHLRLHQWHGQNNIWRGEPKFSWANSQSCCQTYTNFLQNRLKAHLAFRNIMQIVLDLSHCNSEFQVSFEKFDSSNYCYHLPVKYLSICLQDISWKLFSSRGHRRSRSDRLKGREREDKEFRPKAAANTH